MFLFVTQECECVFYTTTITDIKLNTGAIVYFNGDIRYTLCMSKISILRFTIVHLFCSIVRMK